METTEKTIEVLNDLIEINNDRVAGFKKAVADITDENTDLKVLFERFSNQSQRFALELSALVGARAGEVETGKSISGSLHRAWIDVKSVFGGGDRESILSEAERGEDAIKSAYSDAIKNGELSPVELEKVSAQAKEITAAHDEIKLLRDTAKS